MVAAGPLPHALPREGCRHHRLPIFLALLATWLPVPARAASTSDARARALAALQAVLVDPELRTDFEVIREAVGDARVVGATDSDVALAVKTLAELAETELKGAIEDGNDLERVVAALERAKVDGVPAYKTVIAAAMQDRLFAAKLAEAEAASDLRAIYSVLALAEGRVGTALSTKISAAWARLQAMVATTLANVSGLLYTNPGRLRAAMDLRSLQGVSPEAVAEASALLLAEERKAKSWQDIQEATQDGDWWALFFGVAEARAAGVSEAELGPSAARYASEARKQALAAADASIELEDVEAALQFGEAAGVASTVLAPLRQRLAASEKEHLQAALATEDLRQIQDAVQSATHVDVAERAKAEAMLEAKLAQQLHVFSAGSAPELGVVASALDIALHSSLNYSVDEAKKAAGVFLVKLEEELQAAENASALDRLEMATAIAGNADDTLKFALINNDTAEEEYGRIIDSALEVRAFERGKVMMMEELQEAVKDRDPAVLRKVLGDAKAMGCSLFDVHSFEAKLKAKEATALTAKTRLKAAVADGQRDVLVVAIDDAVLAGLEYTEPALMALSWSALENSAAKP